MRARRPTRKGDSYEGFETFSNQLRMSMKMHVNIITSCLLLHVLIMLVLIYFCFESGSIKSMLQWHFAKLWWASKHMQFHQPDGSVVLTTAGAIASNTALSAYSALVLHKLKLLALTTASVYTIYPIFLIFFRLRATGQSMDRHLRGARMSTPAEIRKEMNRRGETTGLPCGTLQIPKDLEPRHALILGSPGSGKTNAESQMLEYLKRRGAKAIVYDRKGDYTQKFYDPDTDLILNPLDKRSIGWNLFHELETPMDVQAVATSLIPHSISVGDKDAFFPKAARDVLAGCMHFLWQENQCTNRALWDLLTSQGEAILAALQGIPEGQAGAKYIEVPGGPQATGVTATLMQYAGALEYMTDSEGTFKVKDWLRQEAPGMIFVTNYSIIQEALRPILSLFVDLVGRQVLSLPDSRNRRIYFMLDEFGSLQRLTTILSLLTQGRSKGACVFLGIQDYGQIDRIYSAQDRQSIVNACGNKILFSVDDPTSARISSDILSETEYMETDISRSMGVSDLRDGTTLSERKRREPLVLPADFMRLQDLSAIVRFKNYDPFLSTWKYREYPDKARAFELRDDLLLQRPAAEPASQEAAA